MPGIRYEARGRLFTTIDRYAMRTEGGEYIDVNEALKPFEGQVVKVVIEEVRGKEGS